MRGLDPRTHAEIVVQQPHGLPGQARQWLYRRVRRFYRGCLGLGSLSPLPGRSREVFVHYVLLTVGFSPPSRKIAAVVGIAIQCGILRLQPAF